jgi:SAM-dependent methyltransferase
MNQYVRKLFDEPEAFSRLDESSDTVFYGRDRFVSHLDSQALSEVERIIGTLILEDNPAILDLMAGHTSHLPRAIRAKRVVGLGLNPRELAANACLTEGIIHDLNQNPSLPFSNSSFDVVLNTVSVDYLTRPLEVFEEVARILKPGGLLLVIFSNRMFPEKAVKIWRESSEALRIDLVKEYFEAAGAYEEPKIFASTGRPRPIDDKYASRGIPSDPIYAVYADKKGMMGIRPARAVPAPELEEMPSASELVLRKEESKKSLRCPYCNVRMKKWAVPQTPFTEWDSEYMYVCFNERCPYLLGGWDEMSKQGNLGFTHPVVYEPRRGAFLPIAVPGLNIMKSGIIEEEQSDEPLIKERESV